MPLSQDDIIILLGAGCSAHAQIPMSGEMLTRLHARLEKSGDWEKFNELYCCVRALILKADAMQGKFNEVFNIERLVAALGEIEKRRLNVLYPFIANFNEDLRNSAGTEYKLVTEFRQSIIKQLQTWIVPDNYDNSRYYGRFFDFTDILNHPLRIFTLNYDMCLEHNIPSGKELERGFDTQHRWDYRRFDPAREITANIYYYKMHGSINWKRDQKQNNVLTEVDHVAENPDLIFGIVNKLSYFDPYLFYAYHFRHYSLSSKIILIIGYSFADEHINGILRQALEDNRDRKIVAVMPNPQEEQIISSMGGVVRNQVKFVNSVAERFLQNITPESLASIADIEITDSEDPFA